MSHSLRLYHLHSALEVPSLTPALLLDHTRQNDEFVPFSCSVNVHANVVGIEYRAKKQKTRTSEFCESRSSIIINESLSNNTFTAYFVSGSHGQLLSFQYFILSRIGGRIPSEYMGKSHKVFSVAMVTTCYNCQVSRCLRDKL